MRLPHRFGSDRFVKYKLTPVPGPQPSGPSLEAAQLDNYLYVDLKTRLLRGPVEFRLSVQFRTNHATMPLD